MSEAVFVSVPLPLVGKWRGEDVVPGAGEAYLLVDEVVGAVDVGVDRSVVYVRHIGAVEVAVAAREVLERCHRAFVERAGVTTP